MNDLRLVRTALLATMVVACSSPAPQQRAGDAELAVVAPLKHRYAGIVMGFDIRPPTTLIVSIDLQQYIETDDDTLAAMRRAALDRWRAAWVAAHPHVHATLHVRFIDFIGRTVATKATKV